MAVSLVFGDTPAIIDNSQPFYLDVVLDTEGANVNALEGALVYPDNLLEVVDIYNGKTVVTGWIQPPTQEGSSIQFAGIMAGGFKQVIDPLKNISLPGNIFRVVFRPLQEGSGVISFENVHVYLNDGQGTETNIPETHFSFTLSPDGQRTNEVIIDVKGPEAFSPLILTSDNVFDGKYFLIFETKDVETGVAYFEVREGMRSWVRAESPYLLTDQTLKKAIRVRAVDNAGNITVAMVDGVRNTVHILLGTTVLLAIIFAYLINRSKKNKKRNELSV